MSLDGADTTLTKKEIKALLDAGGGFLRLDEKGWRPLQFQLSEEDEKELADRRGFLSRSFVKRLVCLGIPDNGTGF